jgi:MFS family permease
MRTPAMRTPAMRTLAIVLVAVGVLLGADEVALTVAAKTLDSTTAAAPLLALWGAGSFFGGLLVTRLGGGARSAAGLAVLLVALTAAHLALIPADGSVLTLGVVLLFAGAAIAPTEATVYAMVDHAAPPGSMTEAFAWLATAMAVGGAAGAASAGVLADRLGPAAAFALAGGAGALAVLTTLLRSRTLLPRQVPAIDDIRAATATVPADAKPPAPVVNGQVADGRPWRRRKRAGPLAVCRAWGDESGFVGDNDGLGAVAQPELVEDSADVRLDRFLGDDEVAGDLGV